MDAVEKASQIEKQRHEAYKKLKADKERQAVEDRRNFKQAQENTTQQKNAAIKKEALADMQIKLQELQLKSSRIKNERGIRKLLNKVSHITSSNVLEFSQKSRHGSHVSVEVRNNQQDLATPHSTTETSIPPAMASTMVNPHKGSSRKTLRKNFDTMLDNLMHLSRSKNLDGKNMLDS